MRHKHFTNVRLLLKKLFTFREHYRGVILNYSASFFNQAVNFLATKIIGDHYILYLFISQATDVFSSFERNLELHFCLRLDL